MNDTRVDAKPETLSRNSGSRHGLELQCLDVGLQGLGLGFRTSGRRTSGSPLRGAGSNCRKLLRMLSFTSMMAAMLPVCT